MLCCSRRLYVVCDPVRHTDPLPRKLDREGLAGAIRMKIGKRTLNSWFIFGEYPNTYLVDLHDGEDDVIEVIDRAKAERIIKAREKFVYAVKEILKS
jgi:hypothetical protein